MQVLDARNARLLYRLTPPIEETGESYLGQYATTQLDSDGDVLVTSYTSHVPQTAVHGWWGNARTQVGQPLTPVLRPFIPLPTPTPSLSEGRIAYWATSDEREGGSIDVLNLATGATRTLVPFSGSAGVEGFSLGEGVLAWAQQSYRYVAEGCARLTPVGSPELAIKPLSAPGPPITSTPIRGPLPLDRHARTGRGCGHLGVLDLPSSAQGLGDRPSGAAKMPGRR